jgi:hypothetical protein
MASRRFLIRPEASVGLVGPGTTPDVRRAVPDLRAAAPPP